MKNCKPEPGEVSPLNSSSSSKKGDSLKRGMNDSDDDGDLLDDEDEVRSGGWRKRGREGELILYVKNYFFESHFPVVQMKNRGRDDDDDEPEEGEDDGDSADGDES